MEYNKSNFLFYQGFLHRTAGEGRGPSFIATLVLKRLLLNEIYHLIELPVE